MVEGALIMAAARTITVSLGTVARERRCATPTVLRTKEGVKKLDERRSWWTARV